jgi:hypothetical protein
VHNTVAIGNMQRLLLLSLLLVGLRLSSSQTSQDGKHSGFQPVTGRMLPPFLGNLFTHGVAVAPKTELSYISTTCS